MIAFVLGNGKSRLAVDLNQLKAHGKVYGCNALYKTFTPDVLVATDPGISEEIQNSGYALTNVFYTRKPLQDLGAKPIREYYGYSSGPIALSLACKDKNHKIFMLGFDLSSADGKFNNVYAGEQWYKEITAEPTYYGNWVKQITEIAENYPVQIVRVTDNSYVTPKEWRKIRNVSIAMFLAAINNNKLEAL